MKCDHYRSYIDSFYWFNRNIVFVIEHDEMLKSRRSLPAMSCCEIKILRCEQFRFCFKLFKTRLLTPYVEVIHLCQLRAQNNTNIIGNRYVIYGVLRWLYSYYCSGATFWVGQSAATMCNTVLWMNQLGKWFTYVAFVCDCLKMLVQRQKVGGEVRVQHFKRIVLRMPALWPNFPLGSYYGL